MSREVASIVISDKLKALRRLSYEELVSRMKQPPFTEFVDGPDGERYQIEVQVFWDSKKGGDVRVIAAVDGGGVSAWKPMSGDFILSPQGLFVGESTPPKDITGNRGPSTAR
jgi:hypothetical protein